MQRERRILSRSYEKKSSVSRDVLHTRFLTVADASCSRDRPRAVRLARETRRIPCIEGGVPLEGRRSFPTLVFGDPKTSLLRPSIEHPSVSSASRRSILVRPSFLPKDVTDRRRSKPTSVWIRILRIESSREATRRVRNRTRKPDILPLSMRSIDPISIRSRRWDEGFE